MWGGGSFGPTSRGYDAAPNKLMRKGLAPFFPIVIVSERYTSQRCANGCSNRKVKHSRGPTSTERRLKARARIAKKKAKEDGSGGTVAVAMEVEDGTETKEEDSGGEVATTIERTTRRDTFEDLPAKYLKKKLRGLFHCKVCHTTWNRDTCAALNILRIFDHQRDISHGSPLTRPWDLNAGPDNKLSITTTAATVSTEA